MKQLIYSIDRTHISAISALAKERSDGTQFFLIDSSVLVMKHLLKLIKRFKFSSELLKLLIKLISGRNQLYIVVFQGVITSEGLVSFGVCNHYAVNKDDCIIGPVNTSTSHQRKGFATFGLNSCLQALFHKPTCMRAFIDTREDNYAMQKVIEKSGFGKSTSSYERTPNKQL